MKKRLDDLLVEKGIAPNKEAAEILIREGRLTIGGVLARTPGQQTEANSNFEVKGLPKYVSRGGEKLEGAIKEFKLDIKNKVCADIGASTGGFTDCLLQNGAKKVYAVDVGRGQLDYKLREDKRVVVMEGVNARYLEELPEKIEVLAIDASFISLKEIIPSVINLLAKNGLLIALIKPQFEADKKIVSAGRGAVKNQADREVIVKEILSGAEKLNIKNIGVMQSPITGKKKKNVEYLALFRI
jgi:23S rRNA (cytidine1920-2'-O)/16S rRNA (cytidine1409-2'-O)-methyltransferase